MMSILKLAPILVRYLIDAFLKRHSHSVCLCVYMLATR